MRKDAQRVLARHASPETLPQQVRKVMFGRLCRVEESVRVRPVSTEEHPVRTDRIGHGVHLHAGALLIVHQSAADR